MGTHAKELGSGDPTQSKTDGKDTARPWASIKKQNTNVKHSVASSKVSSSTKSKAPTSVSNAPAPGTRASARKSKRGAHIAWSKKRVGGSTLRHDLAPVNKQSKNNQASRGLDESSASDTDTSCGGFKKKGKKVAPSKSKGAVSTASNRKSQRSGVVNKSSGKDAPTAHSSGVQEIWDMFGHDSEDHSEFETQHGA